MTPREPERLRVSASEVERRSLDQAAGELPPPEVIGRVARALGVSAAAVDAATKASAGGTSVATAKASAGAGAGAGASLSTAATIPWVSVGVLGVVVAGAIIGVGMWRSSGPSPSSPAPAVTPQAPAVASPPEQNVGEAISDHGKATAAVTAQAPSRVASPPTAPRRAREAAPLPDSRAQTYLVDSARNALAAGSADRALVLLAKYREKYPNGIFLPEVVVLKIEALARLGRANEARTLAARFAEDYGDGPLAERARRVAELPKP